MKSKKTTFQPLTKTNVFRENHSFSGKVLADFPLFVKYLLRVKKECAIANVHAKEISLEIGEKIVLLCHLLQNEINNHAIFSIDPFQGGGGEAINTNLNELIAEFASIQNISTTLVNKSQFTNNVCCTALNAALLELLQKLKKNLQHSINALTRKTWELETGKIVLQNSDQLTGIPIELRIQAIQERLEQNLVELCRKETLLFEVSLAYSDIGLEKGLAEKYRKALSLKTIHPQLVDSLKSVNAAQHWDQYLYLSRILESITTTYLKLAKDLAVLNKKDSHRTDTLVQACILTSGKLKSIQMCYEQTELDSPFYGGFYGIPAGLLIYEILEFLPRSIDNFNATS